MLLQTKLAQQGMHSAAPELSQSATRLKQLITHGPRVCHARGHPRGARARAAGGRAHR